MSEMAYGLDTAQSKHTSPEGMDWKAHGITGGRIGSLPGRSSLLGFCFQAMPIAASFYRSGNFQITIATVWYF